MSKQGLLIACTGLLGGALASIAYQASTAQATVPAAANRLLYSGQLLNGAGALTGAHAVQVEFFSAATNGLSVCGPFIANSNPINGQFTINTSGCDDDFQSAANVFVQLTVDPGTANTILIPPALSSRPRVGAVPFATQADSAVSATSATTAAKASTAEPGSALDHLANPRMCGFTAPTTGKFNQVTGADGYRRGAQLCRAVAGCSTTNATICTSTDVVRFLGNNGAAQLPDFGANGAWIATFHFGAARGNNGVFASDCNSFTNDVNEGPHLGNRVGPDGSVSDADCSALLPILCCDY